MTPDNDPTVRELIETKHDADITALHEAITATCRTLDQRFDAFDLRLTEVARELRQGQDRIERDMHQRLTRIEDRVIETNGRVGRLEAFRITTEAKLEQRQQDRTWFQPVVTGVVTVALGALFVALLNLDKL